MLDHTNLQAFQMADEVARLRDKVTVQVQEKKCMVMSLQSSAFSLPFSAVRSQSPA